MQERAHALAVVAIEAVAAVNVDVSGGLELTALSCNNRKLEILFAPIVTSRHIASRHIANKH